MAENGKMVETARHVKEGRDGIALVRNTKRRSGHDDGTGTNHNVRAVALEERNTFNIYTGVGREYEHSFYPQRKSHPVRLGCDIHPWMSAWIFVFEHPHFAISDEKGRFQITNLVAGDYQLVVRQPDVGYLRRIDVSIEGGNTSKLNLEFAGGDLRVLGRTRKGG